jgi:hypothetical protein
MKMGTIVSPWRYDAAVVHALQIGKSATLCDFSPRLVGGGLPDFAGWSGYPSIAAFLINPGIDAMGQTRTSTVSTYCKIKGHLEAASQLQSGVSD